MSARRLITLAALVAVLCALCVPVVVVGLYAATHHNPDPRQAGGPTVAPWWAGL